MHERGMTARHRSTAAWNAISMHRLGEVADRQPIGTSGGLRELRCEALLQSAAVVLKVPFALIELPDGNRIGINAAVGVDRDGTRCANCFCKAIAASGAPLVVDDASLDERFSQEELGRGPATLRSYLGYPLPGLDGTVFGSIGVGDVDPRTWSPQEMETLGVFARQAVAQLELAQLICENTELRLQKCVLEYKLRREGNEAARAYSGLLENGICQDLAGLSYLLQAAMRNVPDAATLARLSPVMDTVRELLDRYVVAAKRPPVVPYLGLSDALRAYAAAVSDSTGILCTVTWRGRRDLRRGVETDFLLRLTEDFVTLATMRPDCRTLQFSVRCRMSQVVLEIGYDRAENFVRPPITNGLPTSVARMKAERIPASVAVLAHNHSGTRLRCVIELDGPSRSRNHHGSS
jgi:hypothetical protein